MRRPRIRFRIRRTFLALCLCTLLATVGLGSFSARLPATAQSTNAQFTNAQSTDAQSTDVSELVQTGVDRYRAGEFVAAIAPWQSAYDLYKATQDLPALAIVSENLARAYQQMGQTAEEITYWEQAIATAQALNDPQKIGRLLTEQAQAYGRLGQQRRAIAILCGNDSALCELDSALQLALDTGDLTGQVAALGSLGEAYRLSGDSAKALDYLAQGEAISRELGDPALTAAILNSWGNTVFGAAQIAYRQASEASDRGAIIEVSELQGEIEKFNTEAIRRFEQSHQLSVDQQDGVGQMRSLLNLIPAYERANDFATAQQRRQQALAVMTQLPDSQTKAFAAIKLADFLEAPDVRQSYALLNDTVPDEAIAAQASALLNQALAIGEAIENPRVTSFALGRLGNLDERAKNYDAALIKTQAARLAADQALAAKDSLYLWEWQMGRILKKQAKLSAATEAYGQAIDLLKQIRSDILNANRDLQFDFRDTVEPIYREYAELTLRSVPDRVIVIEGEQAFTKLDTTLTTLDSLKVAELQSYFANDCVIEQVSERVDTVSEGDATAVFSTAILDAEDKVDPTSNQTENDVETKRLTVIVSLPNGHKKISQTAVNQQEIAAQVNRFRDTLQAGGSQYITEYDFAPSQQIYNWLIAPFKDDLVGVETLVFVNDGLLRSIPMAALHDGKNFLIEKFAVATTPSLTLTAPERVKATTSLNALLVGVSEPSQVPNRIFKALPAVDEELKEVAKQFANSETLINESFSLSALRQVLAEKDYRVLHMATHGTFGFAPEDNFIVVGAKQANEQTSEQASAFNETLTISELDTLIRNNSDPTRAPIELLTLTACETAIGDNRSTLGLAGVAVRAGVRSAIATLWAISDEASPELITQFYDNLKDPALTKAKALQKAQIAMIQSDDFVQTHPYRWAPFILIGNWL
ncbi:MAG: CHAT domain-containing protein [Phormidesmis sp.]